MDWNLTGSANWGSTHLEQEAYKSFNPGGGSSGGGDFSVDLKLGQVVNGGTEYGGKWTEGGVGKSSKRAKRGSSGNLPAVCLVDGCRSDLSSCREYHRRHKVCELHSKTPQVSIGGQKQRFCQQCSRFHCLEEFDEGKRSCRKRLDGHNRRRRKPQPESVPGAANIISNYQGTQLLSFSGVHTHDPPHTAVHIWPEPDSLLHNQQIRFFDKHNLCLGSPSYLTSKLLQFQAPPGQPLLRTGAASESGGDRTRTLNDRFSDCALSLLSSPRSQTSRSSIPLPHQQPSDADPMETFLGGPFHLGSAGDEPPPTHLPFHWS